MSTRYEFIDIGKEKWVEKHNRQIESLETMIIVEENRLNVLIDLLEQMRNKTYEDFSKELGE